MRNFKRAVAAFLVLASVSGTAYAAVTATWTTINSNNGQPINDGSFKLRALRNWVQQEGGGANAWYCSGDACSRNSSFKSWSAKECSDYTVGTIRRCRMYLNGVPFGSPLDGTARWMFYTTQLDGAAWHDWLYPEPFVDYPNENSDYSEHKLQRCSPPGCMGSVGVR